MTILINRNVLYYTVNSTNNFNLGNVIADLSAPKFERLVVNVSAGSIIWSENVLLPAFTTGELDQFSKITINNYGDIRGAGGDINGGNGGGAVYINSPNITWNNYFAVRGGGGGGGKGASGAPGNWVSAWSQQAWSDKGDLYMFVTTTCPGTRNPTWWAGDQKGTACNYQYIVHTDGKVYTYGDKNPGYPQISGSFRYIKRATFQTGTPGSGGNGGRGRGYNQSRSGGVAGDNGTYRAGAGGTGGQGGGWGGNGSIGSGSGSGSKFAPSNILEYGGVSSGRATTTGSSYGSAGGNAGYAIYGTQSARDSSIFIDMGGTVQGTNNMPIPQ